MEKKNEIFYVFQSSFLIEAALGLKFDWEDETKIQADRKSISSQQSFKPTDSLSFQLRILAESVENACDEMEQFKYLGKTISLKVKTAMFEYITKSITIDNYTNDRSIIYKVSTTLLKEFREKQSLLRLVGVGISNLIKEDKFEEKYVSLDKVFLINLFLVFH